MNITEKDILLAEFMDGKLTEAELLAQYPECRKEVEAIKLSLNALDSLQPIQPKSNVKIIYDNAPDTRFTKRVWYIAASILILFGIGLSLVLMKSDLIKNKNKLEIAQGVTTEEKILELWSLLQEENISAAHQKRLLELAVKDRNSTVRHIALQKLSEQIFQLSEGELYEYLISEKNYNNQTAWIDLWLKYNASKNNRLKQWLNKDDLNPMVKTYAKQVIKNI